LRYPQPRKRITRPSRWARRWHTDSVIRAVVMIFAVLVLVLALLWTVQRRLIYFPASGPVPPAREVVAGGRDITLKTEDGLELGGWFFPATKRDGQVAVLVANGNAGTRALRAPLAQALADEGLAVLLFDYRGYADNQGTPSEDGLALDIRAAYRFLVEEAGVPPSRILYYGESLGAAVVTELATDHPPAGLILRSPFIDLASVGKVHYPFLPIGLLLRDRFALATSLADIEVPTTIVYGSLDSIVPPEQSRAVAEAAPGRPSVVRVEGVDHNDRALLDGPQLISAVVELAARIE
jgi:uncharacterized protein